jgi:tetratricopeptide (TPR) repeat protein
MQEAVELAREFGDKRQLAAALNGLAQVHRIEGALDDAEPIYQRVVALAREIDDPESVAIGLLNAAMVAIGRGRVDAARNMLREVVDIAENTGSKPVGQSALDVAAACCVAAGDWAAAGRFYGAAEAQNAATGLHRDPADEAFLAPLMERARRSLGEPGYAGTLHEGGALRYEDALADLRRLLSLR